MTRKIAIVTGGSAGIGKAIADELTEDYEVITCSRRKLSDANHYGLDVSNQEEVASFARSISERYGKKNIAVLVNNAGGCPDQDYSFENMNLDEWARIVRLNISSVAYVTKSLLPFLSDGGSIINIGSTLAHTPMEGKSLYSMSKGAIEVLTRNLAYELARRKIRVNCVNPGPTDTDLLKAHFNKKGLLDERAYQLFVEGLPFGRVCKPQDIANLVSFLCSEKASMVTGQIISVDGGRTLRW